MKTLYSIGIIVVISLNLSIYAENAISVVSVTDDSIELLCLLPSISIQESEKIDNTHFSVIEVTGARQLKKKGFPELPFFVANVSLGMSSELSLRGGAVEYSLVPVSWREISVAPVIPSKGPVLRNKSYSTASASLDSIYFRDEWYPQEPVRFGATYMLRDIAGVSVDFYPVQYNAGAGKIKVADSIKVKIRYNGAELRSLSGTAISRGFEKVYENHFVNYRSTVLRGIRVADNERMVVVSPAKYKNAMAPFIAWKNAKGIQTQLYEYPAQTGGLGVDALKAFFQGQYDASKPDYFLLVGDYEDIPSPMISGVMEANPASVTADPNYVLLSGNDKVPDAFIGRFSAETEAMVQVIVAKNNFYEQNPDSQGTWYQKASGLASSEGSSTSSIPDSSWMDNFRSTMLGYGYISVDRIYQPNGTTQQIANVVNEGRSWINYMGHGSYMYWFNPLFMSSDVASLHNTGKLPCIISVACLNGAFKGRTCFAEEWQRKGTIDQPQGAVVFLGSSRDQDWEEPQIATEEMMSILTREWFSSIGGIIFNGELRMISAEPANTTFETWHLFGDPSLLPWTKKPVPLTIQHPVSIDTGNCTIPITAPTGTRICFYSNTNGILSRGVMTNSSGNFIIHAKPSDTVWVTGTKLNGIPYRNKIIVNGTGIKGKKKNKEANQLQFLVFPNPATSNITFSFNNVNCINGKIIILDQLGNRVMNFPIVLHMGSEKSHVVWNLRSQSGRILDSGTYLALLLATMKDGSVAIMQKEFGIHRLQ